MSCADYDQKCSPKGPLCTEAGGTYALTAFCPAAETCDDSSTVYLGGTPIDGASCKKGSDGTVTCSGGSIPADPVTCPASCGPPKT